MEKSTNERKGKSKNLNNNNEFVLSITCGLFQMCVAEKNGKNIGEKKKSKMRTRKKRTSKK
jgi:hypothetical protein